MTVVDNTNDDDEVEVTVRKPGRKRRARQEEEELADLPVDNVEYVPLIPDLDKSASNTVHAIQVYKRTAPNEGYKGDVPPTTPKSFIGQRWGDGIYDFEAVNQAGKVLRRNMTVKIAMGQPLGGGGAPLPGSTSPAADPWRTNPTMAESLLERQATQHDKDAERNRQQSEKTLATVEALSTSYASMVREDSQARIERDREYFRNQSEQSERFFRNMMMTMQTQYQQAMAAQREGHIMLIQMMDQSHRHTLAMNNPAFILQMFEKGLKFGQDSAGDADPVTAIVNAGVQGLTQMKDMMALSKKSDPAKLPSGGAGNQQKAKSKGKPGRLSRDQLLEVARLHRIAEKKGYDFDAMISQAKSMLEGAPAQAEEEEEGEETDDESDDGEEGDSNGHRAPGVEGREPTE